MRYGLILLLLLSVNPGFSQNVGIGTNNPDPSAQLDVSSNNKGFLPPRMTFDERNAISNPAAGLVIWCLDCLPHGELQVFNGISWTNLTGGQAAANYAQLPSVTIGTQIWSAKNLDVATYRNGDPIPQVTDPTQWAILTTGAWCWYNNDSATYAATYGKLYNWYAVNDPRGLAPRGWHISNDREWNILVNYIDPNADTICEACSQSTSAGGAMKTITGWNTPNTGATNSSGFAGLPGGSRFDDGSFRFAGDISYWWSASEYSTSNAWARLLYYDRSYIARYYGSKTSGFSVRVVRD